MEIVLISACQKNAIRRTRAVLDRYAFRMGDSTWSTPITLEGLTSLHTQLRATASKNTAVLCLRKDRKAGEMAPVWVVGNRARFGSDWRTPVFVTEGKTRQRTVDGFSSQPWLQSVKRIAAISGLFHDLGKNNQFFAKKIFLDQKLADPIRHEWISTRLIEALWKQPGETLKSVWTPTIEAAGKKQIAWDHPLLTWDSAWSAVFFCVATHPRLLNEEKGSRVLDAGNMIRPVVYGGDQKGRKAKGIPDAADVQKMVAEYPKIISERVTKAVRSLHEMATQGGQSTDYWRVVAFMARAAVILADHQVSSLRCDKGDCEKMLPVAPFANTFKDAKGVRQHNQSLQWHLQSVGQQAAAMAARMAELGDHLDGLSPESLAGIDTPASGAFQWQEDAAQAVRQLRQEHPGKPFLIAVISGTGSGKTRACARLAVRTSLQDEVRFAAIFNLRTLTLQTGRAYEKQLGIAESDLSVVIGDAMTRKAFDAQPKDREAPSSDYVPENEDEMDRSLGEDVEISGMRDSLPEWLQHFVGNDANLKTMLAAPVFVSTADYLAPAGTPGAQGRHILPLLRLMHSDLILDEIDNYDAVSVVAVLRLVQLSGLFGRNVIASSATMTPALANALGRFYAHGAKMRAALQEGESRPESPLAPYSGFACAVISDRVSPSILADGSAEAFHTLFQQHIDQMQDSLAEAARQKTPRKACLLEMGPSENSFDETVKQSILRFHEDHQWSDKRSGKNLSVGLVRVANIKMAIHLARTLRESLANYHPQIACYHGRLLNGQRMMLERDLDVILTRNKDPNQPARHPAIQRHLERVEVQKGLFIVIATPVEEVGRDHDFDWAIIEPSSTQSIVQTAGRVQRHRNQPVQQPNVGVLQYNRRACRREKKAFCYPGNETADNSKDFLDHDLSKLVDWSIVREALDARLRLSTETHPFAKADEHALLKALKEPVNRMTENAYLWVSNDTYNRWPLRAYQCNDEWQYDPDDEEWYIHQKVGKKWDWRAADSQSMHSRWVADERRFLSYTLSEIGQFCEENNLDQEWAFTVSVPDYSKGSDKQDDKKLESDYDGTDFV